MKWIVNIAKHVVQEMVLPSISDLSVSRDFLRDSVESNKLDIREQNENSIKRMDSLDERVDGLESLSKTLYDEQKKENQAFFIDSDKQLSDNVVDIKRKAREIEDRVRTFEDIKQRMDDGIIMMSRKELDKFINNRLSLFEGGIDDKMVGLYRSVEDKVSKGNGKVTDVANLMKKMAVLEGVKDAVEHRRSTKEVIEKINEFKKKMVDLDRTDAKYERYRDAAQLLSWVLGEEKK